MVSIGVTGSSGKTSTKDLMAQIFEAAGPTVAPVGSQNNEIGVPLTACRVDGSTAYLVSEMGARGIGHIAWLLQVSLEEVEDAFTRGGLVIRVDVHRDRAPIGLAVRGRVAQVRTPRASGMQVLRKLDAAEKIEETSLELLDSGFRCFDQSLLLAWLRTVEVPLEVFWPAAECP